MKNSIELRYALCSSIECNASLKNLAECGSNMHFTGVVLLFNWTFGVNSLPVRIVDGQFQGCVWEWLSRPNFI